MKKAIVITILVLFGALTAAPLVFLVCGSLMGSGELAEYLEPVLESTKGYARWRLFPLYPTLRNQMFWNTMKITVGILSGQLVFGLPSAWGLARYPIPGKRFFYFLYILLMMLPFQVTMLSQYLVLNRLHLMDTTWAVIVPGVFSYVPLFLRNTGRTAGSSKDRRCRGMEDFLGNRSAAWFLRNFLGTGAAISGVFQYD